MKTHTQQFKEQIKKFGRELDSQITYTLNNEKVVLGKEQLNSITPHYEGDILKSVMKQLDIDSNVDIPVGTEINYQFGVKVDNNYEYLDFGNYIVYSTEKQEDTRSYKIVCYDKMLYAMKDYESLDVEYPITIKNYLSALCTKIDLTLKDTNFVNYDKEIANELYLDGEGKSLGYTYRDVLDEIAGATASTICINDDDELEVRYVQNVGTYSEVEGDNLTLANVDDGKDIKYYFKGQTSQTGTPTPSSPQPINITTGRQVVSVCGKNILKLIRDNETGGSYDSETDTYSSSTRTGTAVWYFKTETTSLSYTFSTQSVSNIEYLYCFSNNDLSTGSDIVSLTYNSGGTITGGNRTVYNNSHLKYLYVTFRTLTSNVNATLEKPMLEVGETPSTYEEYKGNDYEINLGKNLFYINDCSLSQNGGVVSVSNGNTITITGTFSTGTNFSFDSYVNFSSANSQLGNAMTLSVQNIVNEGTASITPNRFFIASANTFPYLQPNQTTGYQTKTINEAFNRCRLYVPAGTYDTTFNVQLEKGGIPTTFTPYKTPIYLGEIGNYKDYIFKNTTENPLYDSNLEEGQWYIHKEIGRVVLNGSENWVIDTSHSRFSLTGYITNYMINQRTTAITNYYRYGDTTQDGYFALSGANNVLFMHYPTSSTNTVALFKTWLSTHNVEVYYVLNTPTNTLIEDEELINQLESIRLLDGLNNIIITSNDLSTLINLKYLSERDTIDEEYLKDINVNFGEKYGPVNSVVFSRSAESDNIYRQDETSIEENGLHEIKIKDNQILNSNSRDSFIDGVFSQLNGFTYYANDFSSTGIAYYDLCDKYNVKVDDNTYTCIMMNDELDITQGLEEKVHLDIPEKSETDYKKADTTDRRINQAYLIVNKQESTIEGLVSKTQILDNGVYTKEQVDNLLIDSQTGLTNTFSEAGGNNIFRNTGLWFTTTDENNPYEFWSGVVAKQKEENASNMSALLLQNSNLIQEQVVPNGYYTISFRYKKLITLSNPKVYINDIQYDLSEAEDTEFIQIIEVSSQHINIKFTCDVDNGCEVYELMVNAGQVKLAYSQNQNETTTDTVNISKGITITSSANEDIKFKADFDGIRTLDRNNNVITKFTDTGMTTEQAIIKDKSQIVGTVWQEVGEQTWITRL